MTLRKLVGMEGGIEDLQLEIIPKSVVFQNKVVHYFSLYLQKGVQVVGDFQSGNKHNLKDSFFRFKNIQAAKFRIKNLNHATYTWNFYSISPASSAEEFQDSVSFDLKRTLELYESELFQKERDIQTSIKQKNPSKRLILDTWKKIRRQLRTTKPILKCIFPKLIAHLEFQVIISNSLDLELKQEESGGFKMRRSRSEGGEMKSSGASKSKMVDSTHRQDQIIENQPQRVKQSGSSSTLQNINKISDNKAQPDQTKEKDDENTVVMIMNPSGKAIDQIETTYQINNSNDEGKKFKLRVPSKKFSLLSDIIQRSHEGSSSYGGPDKVTSSGDNFFPNKKDYILSQEDNKQPKNIVTESPLLSKFKTLPHQNYHMGKPAQNSLTADLRRAHTAQKSKDEIIQNQYSNVENSTYSGSDKAQKAAKEGKDKLHSGDPYAKYIMFIAILIILVIIGQEWMFQCTGKKCKRQKPRKKI